MYLWHVLVDLPKDRHFEIYRFRLPVEEARRGAFYLLAKNKFCSRKKAHRRRAILRRAKPPCTGVEVDCRKLVTDPGRPGFDVV
jgi:hypothetical protein